MEESTWCWQKNTNTKTKVRQERERERERDFCVSRNGCDFWSELEFLDSGGKTHVRKVEIKSVKFLSLVWKLKKFPSFNGGVAGIGLN